MSLTPVLILLPTYFFFHQKITVREVIGAVVAVGGVTLFFV
jgi:drug/metabolite transporter (DMT)-like permease